MTDEHKTRRRSVNISLPSSPAIQHTSQVRGGGGPRVVVSTAAFHARARGSVPDLCGMKETTMFLPHPRVKLSIVGSLRDRELACSASDRQGPNFESCVWRTVSSHSSNHLQEVFLAQFSLYVHKNGLKPDSFHFYSIPTTCTCSTAEYGIGWSRYTSHSGNTTSECENRKRSTSNGSSCRVWWELR